MALSKFTILYIALSIALVAWIFFVRRKKPSRLNMRSSSKNLPEDFGKTRQQYEDVKAGVKSLDCFFMYNGHEFNAYEVLEVPAGAAKDLVEKAYQARKEFADPSQQEFFRCAYQAILKK